MKQSERTSYKSHMCLSASNEKRLQDPFEKKLQKTFPLGSEVALTIFMLVGLSLEGYVMELSN